MNDGFYSIQFTVSNLEKNAKQHYIRSAIGESLFKQMVDKICSSNIQEDITDYSTKYSLTLKIATPDEYYKDVEQKAYELLHLFR